MAGASSGEAGQASASPAGRTEEEEGGAKVPAPLHTDTSPAQQCEGLIRSPVSPRRYRKMKERLGLTEIRKHANRMTFAEVG